MPAPTRGWERRSPHNLGSGGDTAYSIAVDGSGGAYVAGTTPPPFGFPTAPNAGAFVKKLSADGTALIYSPYLYSLYLSGGIAYGISRS
jgi:hypothetical protein